MWESILEESIEGLPNHECELCGYTPAYFDYYYKMIYLCKFCKEELDFEDEAFAYFLWGMMLSTW
jgi:hypothetical protein